MLDRTRNRLADFTPVLENVILPGLFEIEQQQFESEGGAGGTPWAPLTERYLKRKEAGGYGSRTLIRTDLLRTSLVSRTAQTKIRITKTQVALTSALLARGQYGYYAQHGFKAGRRQVAPRIVIAVSKEQSDQLARNASRYIFFDRWGG